ncbi:MAG: carbon-nitrogen hydrolase family protein [Sediminibacterium sp.]|nr:carbon-nitrogen hydrolase family protein [Sediminibacterium sp.]
MKLFLRIFLVLLLAILLYNIWILAGVPKQHTIVTRGSVPANAIVNFGADSGKGNIVGIQPQLTALNYANIPTFKESIKIYLLEAQKKNLLNEKTVVVFPEYIGTWLVAYEQKESLYQQPDMEAAMKELVMTNIFKFTTEWLTAPDVQDKIKYAALAMKGKQAGLIYQEVFSALAQEFKVTIAAGSIVLPEPSVSDEGKLVIKKGPLYNTAVVFNPDGKIASPLVKKIYPVQDELSFTNSGANTQTPVINTPAGKMGLLVCADSWYPEAYEKISPDVKMLVVPSLGGTDSVWNAPWKGYNGFKAPADVDTTDYGKISEGAAWQKYSMGPRAVKAGVHYGMNVFFSGQIWNMKAEGRVLVLNKDSLTVLPPATGGRIVNLWLN